MSDEIEALEIDDQELPEADFYDLDILEVELDPQNARKHNKRNKQGIEQSLLATGPGRSIVLDENRIVLAGNGVTEVARDLGIKKIRVVKGGRDILIAVQRDDLSEQEKVALALYDNRAGEFAEWDAAMLAQLETANPELMSKLFSTKEWNHLTAGLDKDDADPLADPGAEPLSMAAELTEKYGTALGQIWQLGPHRIMCADSTQPHTWEALMEGAKGVLTSADPPYGMGKEADGIANDNLYGDRLDAFQMAWWKALRPYLEENASAYIWGNADDLWRLWYRADGLAASERMTFRNEIVWNKNTVRGIGSDQLRMYPPGTERCLFFMLGEQGFNNNSDNYWDGWEPIRSYLDGERQKMGWGPSDVKRITGVGMYTHWFTKSQFTLITEAHYRKLQEAAGGKAFTDGYAQLRLGAGETLTGYDALKSAFYATRSYFDNGHDQMLDVWEWPPIAATDPERWGHATPKPVDMIARIIKSSAPENGVVLVPFLGTGPDLIACEQWKRQCRGAEIDPGYLAIVLERWAKMTGQTPVLVDGSRVGK